MRRSALLLALMFAVPAALGASILLASPPEERFPAVGGLEVEAGPPPVAGPAGGGAAGAGAPADGAPADARGGGGEPPAGMDNEEGEGRRAAAR